MRVKDKAVDDMSKQATTQAFAIIPHLPNWLGSLIHFLYVGTFVLPSFKHLGH